MRRLLLGRAKWTVYAVCGDDGTCAAVDVLMQSGNPGIELLSDLREFVPVYGPGHNEQFSKALRDKILEFRRPTGKGGTPRILYFYDANYLIVCTGGELKKAGKTSDALIEQAIAIRKRYIVARDLDQLTIDQDFGTEATDD